MPKRCPIRPTPADAGGQIDARVGKGLQQHLHFTFTPMGMGSGDPQAACAFLELSKRATRETTFDATLACRRCNRAIRLQSDIKP
jgi:hypothetical protein